MSSRGYDRDVARYRIMLKWLPILPFAGFIALMSCSHTDPVDAAATTPTSQQANG